MRKNIKNRLLGVVVFSLSLIGIAVIAVSLLHEKKETKQMVKEDAEWNQFFEWRDK